jgi:hypothetical protein
MQDLGMHIGHLIGRSEAILHHLARIDRRLCQGDERMDELAEGIRRIEKMQETTSAGPAERWAKDLLRWLVPLGALWATGSLEAALRIAGAMR